MKKILMMLVLLTSLVNPMWAANAPTVNPKADSIAAAVADSIKKADMDYLATAIAEAMEETHEGGVKVHTPKTNLEIFMDGAEDTLVPIVIAGILPLGIVITIFMYQYHKKKDRNRVIQCAIEHGQDISAFLEAEQGTTLLNTNDEIYRKGIKNVCIGAALLILLWVIATEIAAVACFPLFMGIGQIVIAKTTKEQKPEEETLNSDTPAEA
ncbi:MAG: DUF6249 domain-containing protein [Bacteroidaceae bacterium]|nr:DUF6249 domain-containing protein [Bacteroidaceae bacterium]